MSKKEEKIKLDNNYGFRFNLFTSTKNAVIQWSWLEKINPRQTVTLGRFIVSVVLLSAFVLGMFVYIYSDFKRFSYEWKSLLFFTIAMLLFFVQYLFPHKDNENEVLNGLIFLHQLVNSFKVRMGWSKKFRSIGIERILFDGTILFMDGNIGKMILVDGSTSKTAYPSDVYHQEITAKSYQNGRNRTTTETKISSSQYQECKEQIKELEILIKKNKKNKAVKDMLKKELFYTKNFIDGKEQTIVQHLILQDTSQIRLEESLSRLRRFVNGKYGLYYSAMELNQQKTIEVFKELYGFY